MKEHPIPQDITNYRFHIVGNMTLKQFVEVGAGCVAAVILYSTGLPSFIKWPFIFLSLGMGAGAAFIPIAERPLDHWIITFFRVMYKPTQYFWERKSVIPAPFLYQPRKDSNQIQPEIDISPVRKERIKEFMASIKAPEKDYALDYSEKARVQNILSTFQQVSVTNTDVRAQFEKPTLEVRIRKLGKTPGSEGAVAELQVSPVFTYQEEKKVNNNDKKTQLLRSTKQIAQTISIPKTTNIDVKKPKSSQEEQILAKQQTQNQDQVFIESKKTDAIDQSKAVGATFNSNLPFPMPPTQPNKLVGMVLTPQNELIPGAIIEIIDEDNRVIRAVKTNALGQFFVTTPLKRGKYIISVEKEGMIFSPQQIIVEDKPLEPMEIHSQ